MNHKGFSVMRVGVDIDNCISRTKPEEFSDEAIFTVRQPIRVHGENTVAITLGVAHK